MGCLTWVLVCSLLVENVAEAVPDEITSFKHKLYNYSLGAFHDFMKTHNKTYDTRHEYKHRYRTFRNNMKKVYKIQALEQGSAVYGTNHLADLTEEEFKRNYLGSNKLADDPDIHWPPADIPDIPLLDSFDWRDHGAVTKVKNRRGGSNAQPGGRNLQADIQRFTFDLIKKTNLRL